MLDNEIIDNNRTSRFSWFKGLRNNKATYSTLGVIGLTSGIILTVVEPVTGYGALFAGISLTAVGTVCAMAYSHLKMKETKGVITEISQEIKEQEKNPPKYSISNNSISNINSIIQGISATLVIAGSSSAYTGTYKEVFDNEENEETILKLGISGSLLIAAGMICGVFSHNYLARILANRRNDIQTQKAALQVELMNTLTQRLQNAEQELDNVRNIKHSNEELLSNLQEAQNHSAHLNSQKNELEQKLNTLDIIHTELEEKYEEIYKEKNELTEQIVFQQKILNARETEFNNLQSSYNKIERSIEDKNIKISYLKNKLQTADKKLLEIQQGLNDMQQANQLLSEELNIKTTTINLLNTEIDQLKFKVEPSITFSSNM